MILLRCLKGGCRTEVIREMIDRAHDGIGREAAQRAERTEFHRVREVRDQSEVLLQLDALRNLVDTKAPGPMEES